MIQIGHYYTFGPGGNTLLAASSSQSDAGVFMIPVSKMFGVWLTAKTVCKWTGQFGAEYLRRADFAPALVIEGRHSSRGYTMRALKHSHRNEVLYTAGCRMALGGTTFATMLRRTQRESVRSERLQTELLENLMELRKEAKAAWGFWT